MQQWALLLSAYSYTIELRQTKQHANADGLSRLPLHDKSSEGSSLHPAVFNIQQVAALPAQTNEVVVATGTDPTLSKLLTYLRRGWPKLVPGGFLPFWWRKEALSLEGDYILWGCRVVIPERLESKVLGELHH